jgi:(R,R)-butanediol dehydrogenase / meso-butanediol dehydrogenase / diacetyl reductase
LSVDVTVALCEPLAVAWHAIKLADFKEGRPARIHFSDSGQSALILGAGPIGLAVLLCLKAFGAKTTLISEIAAMRKLQAEKFGADKVLDPTQVDVVREAQELCDGYTSVRHIQP